MIASACALLGITFFALPAGILGSGFALKVQQQQRQKHMIRRRQPAAALIQCLWRCYAADENSMSVATWKIHQVPLPSPPSFKHNASFVTRLPTIRRHRNNAPSPSIKSRHTDSNHALDNLVNSSRLNTSQSDDSVVKDPSETYFTKKNSDDEDEEQGRVLQLTSQHKGAIRALRKIKYFVVRRKFKEALKPYDVKDVIEQYSSGHADILTRVKNLHGRLDQILGKQGSKSKDVYESKISLASRIVKVERQVDDIESKLDQLMDLYMEDRKRLLTAPLSSVPLGGSTYPTNIMTPSASSVVPGKGMDETDIPDHVRSPPLTVTPPASILHNTSSLMVPGASGQIFNTAPHSTSLSKPRPILIDKQASEPNTPTNKQFDKPMSRGNSDISHRMKKRVTLSSLPPRHSLEAKDPDYLQVPPIVKYDYVIAPYIDEDCDTSIQDDDTENAVADCDSPTIHETDCYSPKSETFTFNRDPSNYCSLRREPSIIQEEPFIINEELHVKKEEPTTPREESEHTPLIIPTISAHVARASPVVDPIPPPSSLRSPGSQPQFYHHPHLQHHQPRSQRSSSSRSASYSSLLPVLERPTIVTESVELHSKDSSRLLPRGDNIVIAVDETTS